MKNNNPFEDFKKSAQDEGLTVYISSDKEYPQKKEICNSRFSYSPGAIACCVSNEHVQFCIRYSKKYGIPFLVRSGGHQHEGMCTTDGVILIDLSLMNSLAFVDDKKKQAYIGAGAKLEFIYSWLDQFGLILPGGGCGSVCIGGLAQGGGWGFHSRKWGLTCDNLLEAEVVLADGSIVIANKDINEDLYWAIRGGGGGNFGVITKFLFTISSLGTTHTIFEIHWSRKDYEKVVLKWIELLPTFSNDMTTACRLGVVDKNSESGKSMQLFGQYYGTIEEARNALKQLYDLAIPFYESITSQHYPTNLFDHSLASSGKSSLETPNFNQPSLHVQLGRKMQEMTVDTAPPSETCGTAPNPHKVSSLFPKSEVVEKEMIKACIQNINNSIYYPSASMYLSIHSFGGAIKNVSSTDTAFAYRDRNFLLQFQAWWSEPLDPQANEYISWIENFKNTLSKFSEGAFINFPDCSQPLIEYYGSNFTTLQEIKKHHDPDNRFSFPMSIPLPT